MGRIPIETKFQSAARRSELEELMARLDNPRGFYETVGERLLGAAADRFKTETGPDGLPWDPLQPATIKAREKAGQTPITILRSNSKGKSGSALAGSLSYEAGVDEVKFGSPLPYAAIHQFGGTIKIPARQGQIYRAKDDQGQLGRRFVKKDKADVTTEVSIPAHEIRIPARPFLGIGPDDEAGIFEDAVSYLQG